MKDFVWIRELSHQTNRNSDIRWKQKPNYVSRASSATVPSSAAVLERHLTGGRCNTSWWSWRSISPPERWVSFVTAPPMCLCLDGNEHKCTFCCAEFLNIPFAVHFNGIYVIDRERKMKHLLSMTFFLSQVCWGYRLFTEPNLLKHKPKV